MNAEKLSNATECKSVNQGESADQYITLGQAGQVAPGRPSANAVWRWCRKGVQSRSGERVKLAHVRAGGKLFTTAAWVHDFGRKLAEADATYFDQRSDVVETSRTASATRRAQLDQISRELDAAGL